MILLLKQYRLTLAGFISGLVIAVLLSLGIQNHQLATAFIPTKVTVSSQPKAIAADSDFAASHLEPNFYQ